MASYLLKNQILKHLSRFFKNFNPNQLSTSSSTISLHDLELNEDTLKSLFLLTPSSSSENESSLIRISSARCTSVSISIPWTSITTSPICINFDQLLIVIEILETPASTPEDAEKEFKNPAGDDEEKSYGFVDKIIDGISFSLNSLHVKLKATHFTASLDLSFLKASPSPPNFKQFPGRKQDLRLSRIKCAPYILLFRMISWQTLKLEAKARDVEEYDSEEEDYRRSSADVIRLISSGGSCNITVKKSLLNRQVVCIKSSFHLEDILWLLTSTSSQSRGAMALVQSISNLVVSQSSSGHQVSAKAPRSPSKSSVTAANMKMDTSTSLYKIFAQFDFLESSVHFNLKTFQLQIVDDMNISDDSFHSKFPPLASGSALLFSATGVVLSLYPEYNPRRGFKQSEFSEEDTSLHVVMRVSTMQLHCVGLNDSRLRTRKRTDDEKNKYFLNAPIGVPDVIPAVEISMNHFYVNDNSEDGDESRTDSANIKIGPMRVCVDEPTLLWINAFVLPIVAAGSSVTTSNSQAVPHVDVKIELIMPVIVMTLNNPFEIFPSPFSFGNKNVIVDSFNDVSPDTQIEISCTKVMIQRIRHSDMTWFFRADPLWIDLVNESLCKKDQRHELVSPFNVLGTAVFLPKTEFSMEEARIAVEVTQGINVTCHLNDLVNLLKIVEKLGIFADFIAKDKLEMKRCCQMLDSLLTVSVKIPGVIVSLVRVKCQEKEVSESASDSQSDIQIPRSISAPEDLEAGSVALPEPEVRLSTENLLGSHLMDDSLAGSSSDLVSLDSRISDEDDQYILKHINVPVSMSSSPSLLQISNRVADAATPTESVEEAEDVTATMLADVDDEVKKTEREILIALLINDLNIEKQATDLHSVTIISTRKGIVLQEALFESESKETTNDSCLMIRSEIKWSEDKGKQELTSILLRDQEAFNIHGKTIETITECIPKSTTSLAVPDETPAVSIFLQRFLCSLLHDVTNDPVFTLKLDSVNIQKDPQNILSIEPLGSQDHLYNLEQRHAELFGSSVISCFKLYEENGMPAKREITEDVVQQLISRQEELEAKIRRLELENSMLKLKRLGSPKVNDESD